MERTEKAFINLTDPDIKVNNISPQDYINKVIAKILQMNF